LLRAQLRDGLLDPRLQLLVGLQGSAILLKRVGVIWACDSTLMAALSFWAFSISVSCWIWPIMDAATTKFSSSASDTGAICVVADDSACWAMAGCAAMASDAPAMAQCRSFMGVSRSFESIRARTS